MAGPLFLSPEEVASMLGVHRRTVYRWLHGGKLPTIHAGSQWRIDLADLQRFLKPRNRFDAARGEALVQARASVRGAVQGKRTSRPPRRNAAALELLDRLYASSSVEDGVDPPQPPRFMVRGVNGE